VEPAAQANAAPVMSPATAVAELPSTALALALHTSFSPCSKTAVGTFGSVNTPPRATLPVAPAAMLTRATPS